MGKREFILLIGLLALATVFPMDAQSASSTAAGTPDNQYQALIGEWRGWFGGSGYCRLIIHEIDLANAKARCTYTLLYGGYGARSMDNQVRADFIPQPNPKVKWEIASGENQFEFVLKDKVLEGTITGKGNLGPTPFPVAVTMEKYQPGSPPLPDDINIIPPSSGLSKELAAFLGKWKGTFEKGTSAILVVEEIQDTWAQVVWSVGGETPNRFAKAEYWRIKCKVTPGPKPKIQFVPPGKRVFTPDLIYFEVKDPNTLEGAMTGRQQGGSGVWYDKAIMTRTK